MTEDVHQKRIGTGGSIQLASFSIMTRKVATRGTVGLVKAPIPFRLAADALVRARMEISMSGVGAFAEYDGRHLADRALVRQAVRVSPGESARAEFLTQSASVAGHAAATFRTQSRVLTDISAG
jgi:hypothetical protein